MSIDRLPYSEVKPHWRHPSAAMTARYLSHPELRVAFIQSQSEPDMVYVVSDEPLPETLDEAVAVIAKWRGDHEAAPQH
jgi:hypothetical protein